MHVRIGKDLVVDPDLILQSSHGRRSIDTFQLYDARKANWQCPYPKATSMVIDDKLKIHLDVSHVENLIPKEFGLDAKEVPGARRLLASLEEASAKWAIGKRCGVVPWKSSII